MCVSGAKQRKKRKTLKEYRVEKRRKAYLWCWWGEVKQLCNGFNARLWARASTCTHPHIQHVMTQVYASGLCLRIVFYIYDQKRRSLKQTLLVEWSSMSDKSTLCFVSQKYFFFKEKAVELSLLYHLKQTRDQNIQRQSFFKWAQTFRLHCVFI